MTVLTKRTTINIDLELYQALKLKAAVTDRSLSSLINELIRESLVKDADDLRSFQERADEPVISREDLLEDLQIHGKQ